MAGMFTAGNGIFYGTTLMDGSTNASFGTIYQLAFVPQLNLKFFNAAPALALTVNGLTNQSCQIQISSNLINWTTFSNLSLTSGTAQLLDFDWTNSPTRYYRAMIP